MNTAQLLCLLSLLSVIALQASALTVAPGFVCPEPAAYPKGYLADLLPAAWTLTGTLDVDGHVLVDTTGRFAFQEIGNITGKFLQYYIKSTGIYFAQYYVDIEGAPFLLMNMTFSPLDNGEHCLIFSPFALVPYYVHGHQASDRFFYTTHYHSKNGGTGSFGSVAESEFFFVDDKKENSSNCLTAFNADSSIKTMTCFNYRKISNKPIVPEALKRSTAPTLSGKTVRFGKFDMPIEAIAPESRANFAVSAA